MFPGKEGSPWILISFLAALLLLRIKRLHETCLHKPVPFGVDCMTLTRPIDHPVPGD